MNIDGIQLINFMVGAIDYPAYRALRRGGTISDANSPQNGQIPLSYTIHSP